MNRYWTRIGLGAGLIFCLGLAGMAAVRKGKAEVRSFLSSAATRLPMQLAHLGFRLDGRQIGEITGIKVEPSHPGELGNVSMRVALSDLAESVELADCALTAVDANRWNTRSGFRCAEASEIGSSLVSVGEVVFEPGSITRPLYLPQRLTERWRHSGVRQLQGSLTTDGRGGVSAEGRYDLEGSAGAGKRGTFTMVADPKGAMFSVRDEQGRRLVEFRANQLGVNLNIRDREGRNLVRLLADSIGAALRVR